MSSSHKSIFDTSTSEDHIKKTAQQLQQYSLESIAPPPSPKKHKKSPAPTSKTDKLGHLYVSSASHRQAKIKASLRAMTLQAYISWLIEQDQPDASL